MPVKPPQTLSPRSQRNRERMTQSILDTARTIMREHGVAALSMHELARRLEMRPPSLYNYFSGLMDIYDALFRLGFTLWGEYLDEHTQGAQTWQDEVRLSMQAYLTFAMQNPELFQLCFERPVPGFVPSEPSLQVSFGALNKAYARIASLKEDLRADLPPEQIADLVIAITHGLTALHMANEPHLPLGQGRFGALIPAALEVLDKAWSKP
ncbi:MAG: TetR/AcrR family transcriptional regulator [Chloroflexota bacterium]